MTDSILQRIAEGRREAVDECLNRYSGLVWALARRLCQDPSEAEDAVQEIFIELWTKADRFDPSRASEPTFVAMIARRRLIDRRRQRNRRPESVPLADDPEHAEANQVELLEQQDEARRALQALDRLRPEQREVLTLSIQQGLTYDQIAQRTGMPPGTVKTHARRGLIRLRELLDAGRLERAATLRQEGL